MKHLRRLRTPLGLFMTVLVAVWQITSSMPLRAATLYWDTDGSTTLNNIDGTNIGGTGTWDTSTNNWWNLSLLTSWPNTIVDHAIFTGTPGTVTLTPGIIANRLTFQSSGYVLTGGDLTLAGTTPTIHTNTATTARFNTQILGTGGLTKTGAGTVYLNNATNGYTGITTISNGTLVIGSNGALGADTSTVVVTGAVNPGTLFLAGSGYNSGFTLSRDVSISGGGGGGGVGTGAINGIALVSNGDNTLTGTLTSVPGVGTPNTGLTSTFGLLTLGDVVIGGTPVSNYTTFGSANSQGNYAITGTLSGTGSIQKAGVGTLLLDPTDASGFSGTIRITSGSLRISSASVLGTNAGTGTSSTLDFNGGTLEVRSDSSLAINKNVYHRGGGGVFFVDHAVGGTAINGTVTFGALAFEENLTTTFNGRNGYSIVFGAAPVQGGTNVSTFTNNLSGLLTFNGTFWSNTDTTSRTMTIGGNGNTLINGSVNATATGATNHNLTKTGTGTLTITGTASTLDGTVNINGGTLAISDFRSINNNTETINIGTTTTAGTLSIIGNNLTLANITTSKVINLAGTTGAVTILANQTGTSPGIVLNANFTATGGAAGDAKVLTFGGLNTADNTINGIIPNNAAGGTVNLVKTDAGTWVLAGNNTYSGSTTISNGLLKLKASAAASDIIKEGAANTIVFNANATTQSAGGTLQFTGVSGVATTETLGALTTTAGMGTIRLVSGGGGAAANLIFTSAATPGKAGGVNFITTAGGGGTVTLTGVATSTATTLAGNGHFYINGADFARSNGGVLVAPVYGTDAGFVNAAAGAATLTAASHNQITGNITAQGLIAITSLKMTTHALTLTGNLTVNTGAAANDGGILVTGGTTASISGGALTTGGGGTLVFRVDGINDVLTLNSPMLVGTTGGFTKNGAGTLILTGNNLQVGTNTINEGTVRLSGGSARLSAANTDIAIRQGAILDLNGVNSGTAIKALNGAGTITNGTSAATTTLTIGNGNGGGTFSGIIEDGTGGGVLNVTKVGTTAQTLSGLNTYSGVTTIGSTALVSVNSLANIGTASSIGRGDSTSDTTNAASLVFDGTTGGLNYTGSASVSIDRLFTLNGSGAGSGAQIANASAINAALIFNNTGAIRFGAGATVAQTLILGGASTADNQFNLQITDNASLKTNVNKTGAGLWILGGASNTYTGTTTITDGILVAQDGSSLSNNSGLLLGAAATSGTFQSTGNFTRNLSTVALTGANTVSWNGTTGGGGFAASTGKLVVAIGGLATPTNLQWGTGGFVGTGGTQALILNSTMALGEVEFRNAIDLNGATRTITVNDNTATFTDFATITGVISGTGGAGITKGGTGLLQLLGANTYNGSTAVTAGTLVVTSLGNSSVAGASSVGATGLGSNTLAQALTLGNAGTTAGVLVYVGAGEVSDRYIQLNTTTGNTQIIADGTGALVLTNVQNTAPVTGAKSLFLRGSNNFENMITNVLTNDGGGGTLAVVHDGPGTWILTGDNLHSGTTSANAGALGIGHDNAMGTGTLSISNGAVFAYGGDRTLNNTITQGATSGTIATFFGDYSLYLNGAWNDPSTTSTGRIVRNNIVSGKVLQINGNYSATAGTTSPGVTFDGSGDTIINGIISTTMTNFGITYAGTGTLTLAGANTYTGATTLTNGTLILGANEVIPDGATKGNVVFNPGAGTTATLDLSGRLETINGLTANSLGTAVIDNTSATTAALIFGANDAAVNFGTGAGNYTITDSGPGALSIIKTGAGAGVIGTNVTLTYQGTTSVTGGSLTIGSAVNGTTGLSVTNAGSVLALTGGITNTSVITSVTVGDGSTLSLLDGAGNKLTSLTSLTLGSAAGTSSFLNLNVGDGASVGDNLNTDFLSLLTGGTLTLFAGNQIVLNLTDAGLNANKTYNLLASADGGLILGPLTAGEWVLGSTPGGFASIVLNKTDNLISITTGNLVVGALYWNANGAADNWNDQANWSTNKAGTLAATTTPGQGTDVVFIADNIAGGVAITTTLEQNFKINSLSFEASTLPADTPASVTINAGVSATNRLEIAPQNAANGISISAGGPVNVTIAAPLRIGANQTWNVTDAGSALTISGPLQGEADVTKTGAGKVILSGVADPLFNAGLTTDFIVNGGNLELANVAALGTVVNNNLANITVNTGGGFYFKGAASTTVNNITLAGGTLSAGTNTQTYSGSVAISADSFINMRDSNSAILSDAARSITLSGVLSGTGKLTVDSANTISGSNLNQISGTLTLSNANASWSGGIDLLRGTITATNVDALGTGNINASFGRIIFSTAGGTTFNLNQNITLDAVGGILELQANASGTPVSDMTVNFGGTLTLGGVNANMALRLLQDADNFSILNFTGPVILGGNASISTAGSATRANVISGVISEVGGARSLTINDDLGGWAQTNQTLRLTGLNTFTGGITVASGTLEFTTVSNNGGPASSLGMGTDGITLAGTLSFIGDGAANSQTTNRAINTTASSTLSASGTNGASITYTGAITQVTNNSLTLTGTSSGQGFITGGITQVGTAADLNVNSGIWTLSGATKVIADDTIVTGPTAVLNLNSTGVLTGLSGASNGLYARGGATINLNAADTYTTATGLDFIILGDNSVGGAVLNTNTFNITTPRLDLGQATPGFTASIIGTGTVTVGTNINLYQGTVSAGLAGGGAILKGFGGTVTLSGDNSGLTGTTAARVDSGILILDYTTSNTTKLRAATGLDMRGGTLVLEGNASATTTQTVASLTLGGGGASKIDLNSNGFATTLNLGAITRAALAGDGTIRFELPVLGNITTTTANNNGILGAYATVRTVSGVTNFAANDGANNIVAVTSTDQDNVGLWVGGQNVSDVTGFTGSGLSIRVNSIRFNADAASNVTVLAGGTLVVGSGGILMTDNVTSGAHSISGGVLSSANGELIFTQDSTAQVLNVSSSILTGGLSKAGNGGLNLSGVNHYTSQTDIQAGTLTATGGFAIGDASAVTLADDQASSLVLAGNEVIGSLAGGSSAAGLTVGVVNVGSNTLTIRGGGIYAGIFSGNGTIIRDSSVNGTNFNLTGSTTSTFTGSVVVNGGLFQLSGATGRLSLATSFTINKGGNFLIDNNDDNSPNDRIADNAAFILNSADGTFSGVTLVRGLAIRTDNNGNEGETIGVLTFGSGASYFSAEASGGTSAIAAIIADNFVRTNNATLDARGRNLGGTANERTQLRIGTTANETAFIGTVDNANLVGGGGAAGTKTIDIVPWAIGENTTGALADTNMGNSLVTYVAGAGFRALDFATEYNTFATRAGATDNIRESLTTDLTTLTGVPVNALVLHNNNTAASTVNVTGAGAGQTLTITSGALLFTLNSGAAAASAHNTVLGGFDGGIAMGGAGITNEYVIHVVNPSSAAGAATLSATINSNLISTADITKAGRGTLILTGTNTAGGGTKKTTINEGVLEIADLDNIGGGTGGLVFAGGTLRLVTGFTDDISTRSITMLQGGGTLDTNGMDFVLANGFSGGGTGSFTKIGLGTLTFAGNATYTGSTFISNGRIILGGGGNNRLSTTGGVTLGSGTDSGVLQLGTAAGATNQTVAELSTVGTGTANAIVGGNAALSTLTINQNTATTFAGSIGGLGADENNLSLVKSGVGILTLSGSTLSYAGTTTVSAGVLNITGSTAAALSTTGISVAANAAMYTLNGAGQAINLGAGPLNLGSGTGATVLGFEVGATSAYDSFNTTGAAITANSIVFNLTGITGFGAGNYDLLTAGSGLSGGTYALGTLSGTLTGFTFNLITSDTFVRLSTAASTGDFYWRGGISNSWMGNSGTNTNFTTDLAGTINANGTPGAASTVYFSAQNATGPAISTTLDGNFAINDLRFLSSPTGVTSVTIAPGTPTTSSLTIAPSSSTLGIDVADNAGAITISAPLVLGANQTWNVVGTGANGSSLRVAGGSTGGGNVEKTGLGTVTLLGANTYTGTTTITAGIWQAGGTNGLGSASTHIVGPGTTLRLNGFSSAIGALSGSGTVDNNTATGATLTAGGNNATTTFSGSLVNGSTGALGLAKTGTGRFTLSGTNTYTGTTTVNGGSLEITGNTNTGAGAMTVGSAAGTRGTLLVGTGGALTTTDIDFGSSATGAGAAYQTDGTVVITGADGTNRFALGNIAGGYGYYKLSGGTLTSARLTMAGNSFAGASGVYEQTGGTATFATWAVIGHGSGNAMLDISGGNFNVGANFAFNHVANAYSVMNVRGTGVVSKTGTGAISLMQGNANSVGNVGILNVLAGGTLATNTGGVTNGNGTGSSGNVALLNFNGGTLKTLAASTTLINITGASLTANSGAYIYSGGMTVDTNGFDSTINGVLRAPDGVGVQSIAVTNGGSGYIGAPVIKVTGGTGVGATAIANMVDDGTGNGTFMIGSITITNPGTGYLGTDVLTLSFGDNTAVYTSQAVLGTVAFNAGNVSGGLTKIGNGTLTLSGANTYTGGTFVNVGTLALGANNVLADAGVVTVNGGIFNMATFSDTVGVVTLQSGAITGTTGALTGSSYMLEDGLVSAILAGSGSLTKTTAGTVTLSGTNTFSGSVNVNGGTLAFSAASNLGNGSATNTINVNGGTMNYTGAGSTALTAAQNVTVGAGGATFDITSSTGVFTVAGNVTGSAGGDLIKTGSGTLVLAGTNSLGAGGATNVAAGTLRAGFGTNGTSTIAVSSSGTLEFVNGVAQVLTLDGTAGALTLTGGATLAFELGVSGTNDAIIIASGGTALTSGTITLNFLDLGTLNAGTYDLITILGGGGGLNAANFVVGNAPAGFNYTINKTDNLVQLITTTLSFKYWRGDVSNSWAAAGNTNWSSDAAGTIDPGVTPGAGDTVIFSASNAPLNGSNAISTTLDGSRTIDSLQFINVPTGITSVTIAQGSGSGTLTIAPATASNGILVADNGGNIIIDAPIIAATAQTWNVVGTGTNGSSLTVNGNTTFTGHVTKIGGGVLTLSGGNGGAGGVTLAGGTLNINSTSALGTGTFTIGAGTTINNSTAGAITLAASNAMVWDGSFTFTGTQSLNLGTGAVTLGATTTITTTANTLTVGGIINDGANDFALTKAGAGVLTLSGANTFSGGMVLSAGTLNINNASAIGTGDFTIDGGTIDNTSGGDITLATNNAQIWNGNFTFTGSNNLNLGTGPVNFGTAAGTSRTVTVTAGNLTVGGAITNGAIANSLVKLGGGTLTLAGLSTTAANNYTGSTTLGGGTTVLTSSAVFTGGLTIGSAPASTVISALDLTTASATFNGPTVVQTNSTTANTITIGAGQSLQLNGSVMLGYDSAANTNTRLTVSGAGTFRVGASGAPTNANVTMGGNTVASGFSNATILDMSGLATFYANLGTGTFRVGSAANGAGGALAGSTLILAADSTIIATTITSDSPDSAVTQAIKLGSGTNVFNATTISIGASGNRSNGTLDFSGASGTLEVRNLAGDGRANMNLAAGGSGTAASYTSTVNLAGHHADLLLGTLAVAGRSAGTTGSGTASFTFDTGILDATAVNVGARTGTSMTSGSVTGTVTLGGGASTIGTMTLGTNSVNANSAAGTGDATATLNISAGTHNITTMTMGVLSVTNTTALSSGSSDLISTANFSGGTITVGTLTMGANNSAATTVTANTATSNLSISGTAAVNVTGNLIMGATTLRASNTATAGISITGGSLTVGGNIQYTNGLGTENNTVTLNGGSLDMTGGDIGSGTALVTFNAQSGTLSNVAQINGGAGLTKTGLLTLILEGLNTYTGGTTISAGVLQVGSGAGTGTLGSGTVTNNATLRFNRNNSYTVADTITGTGAVEQVGTGTTVLEGTNDYSGGTSISAGTLQVNSAGALGNVGEIKFTGTGGTLQYTANNTVDYSARIANSTAAVRIDTNGQTVTYASALAASNIGGLIKEGTGTLRLNAANAYVGSTTVNGGTLVANNTAALSAGDVAVNAGGTLSVGDGARLNVNVGGSLSSSGTLQFDIFNRQAGTNPVTSNDLLTFTSADTLDTITLSGTLSVVDTTGTSNTSWALNDVWKLIDWAGFAGTIPAASQQFGGFTTLDLPTLSSGMSWRVITDASGMSIAVVPEPSRLLLLGLGFTLMIFRRRRR